jgi:hypothetical protein
LIGNAFLEIAKHAKIPKSRKIGTLAGSYTSSEMVVLRNLRLPELDKNRNVDQQKALVFDADFCRTADMM